LTNPLYHSKAWRSTSKRVLERDGYRCQIRLPGCLGRATAADHIVELADGGELLDMANLQAACKPCNTAKRNTMVAARARRMSTPLRRW
jgi:5-methylcytosine-specific restriction protein A